MFHDLPSTQTAGTAPVQKALDDLSHATHNLQAHANDMARQGLDAMRDGSRQMRRSARHAGEDAVDHIRSDPVKSVLVAAAAGALLVALVGFFARPRPGR